MSTVITKNQVVSENKAEVERLLTNIQDELIKNYKSVMSEDDKNFTGNLSNSWEKGIAESNFKTVQTSNPYAVPVEWGLPRGVRVNFDALRKWVKGKLGVSDDDLDSVTIKIFQKIQNKGIRAARPMKKAIKKLIAKRGIVRASGFSGKRVGRLGKMLNKIVRISKKISRVMKRITRNINRINSTKRLVTKHG